MRFDTIIIGGGLSGLICGIQLQKSGQKCAIVSAGQNALHFFSGGFGLLSRLPDRTPVAHPLDAIGHLDGNHPYRIMGCEAVEKYAEDAREILRSSGISVSGDAAANRCLITATGTLKPAWLTSDDIASVSTPDTVVSEKALIVNIEGFLDFNTAFIAEALEKRGTACRIEQVRTEGTARLRRNPSEMRSANIAMLMENGLARKELLTKVKALVRDEKCVILPAVFGLRSTAMPEEVRNFMGIKTLFIGTMPPSVTGIRMQGQLKRTFEMAGGTFLMGDEATGGLIGNGRLQHIMTANMGDELLQADSYVLATGSYFGHGLTADMDRIYETVFGLDVQYSPDRGTWYDRDLSAPQGYLGFGARTDRGFHAMKDGKIITNLYAAGSVLGGCNPLSEGSGGGIAMLTALCVAEKILKG